MKNTPILLEESKTWLRNDLQFKHTDKIKEELSKIGIKFVTHNIIYGYEKDWRRYSSYSTNPEWQELFWSKLLKEDRMGHVGHRRSESGIDATFIWTTYKDQDDVLIERMKQNNCNEGITVVHKQKNNIIENYSFGWENPNYILKKDDISKIKYIINPLVQEHLDTFSNISLKNLK